MTTARNALGAVVIISLLAWSISFGAAPPDRDAVEQHLRDMLTKTWSDPGPWQKAAEEHFKAAVELRPDDPRIYHAYGLVLLKHLRYTDAKKQIEAAVERSNKSYLPAWQLAIHLQVRRGEHEPALVELTGWIRAVVASEAKPDTPQARLKDEYIAWTGRMMGYLEKPAGAKRIETQRKELDAEIIPLLDDDQRQIYNNAKAEVLKQHADIADLRDRRRDVAKKDEEKQKQKREAQIKEEKSTAEKEQEKLEMSAEQWQAWIDRELPEFDRQFSALEREYSRLEADALPILRLISDLESEIRDLQARRDQALREDRPKSNPPPKPDPKPSTTPATKPSEPKPADPKASDPKAKEKEKAKQIKDSPTSGSITAPGGPNVTQLVPTLLAVALTPPLSTDREAAAAYQRSIDRLTLEIAELRREYAVLDQRAIEIKSAAADVIARRQAAIAKYQRATGKLIKDNDELKARVKKLSNEAKVVSQPATGKTTRDANMANSAASLSTYVPVNLDQEKQRLLDSFAKP